MWYIIVAAAILSLALSGIFVRLLLSHSEWGKGRTFICTECKDEFFVPTPEIYLSGFAGTGGGINDENKRMLKCPSCGKKCLCVMKDHSL